MINKSIWESNSPLTVSEESIQHFLNILLANPFVRPYVSISGEAYINETIGIDTIPKTSSTRRRNRFASLLVFLVQTRIKVTCQHPSSFE